MPSRMPVTTIQTKSGKSAEELLPYLTRVVEIAPSLIYVFNQDAQANEYSNRSIGDMMGYSPKELAEMGTNLMPKILHPEDIDRVFGHFADVRALEDGAVSPVEYRVRHKDGSWRWLLSHDTIFRRNEIGEVTHHIGSAIDITLQKESEMKETRATRSAVAVNDELREFAYAVSHDMKSPTNTLQLLLAELNQPENAGLSADQRKLLDMSVATVENMREQIEDVLNYTRIIGQDVVFEKVDLSALLSGLLKEMCAEIERLGASVEVGSMPMVLACETQIRSLFQNLIDNALKFRRADVSPMVKISATLDDWKSDVIVSVKDNGIGIPAAHTKRVFHLFEQLKTEKSNQGTGLGLAICRRIATNHGSEIEVSTEEGRGTEFSIRLAMA